MTSGAVSLCSSLLVVLASVAPSAKTIAQSTELPQYKVSIDVVHGKPVSEPNAIYRGRGLVMVGDKLVVLEGRGDNAGIILEPTRNGRACSFGSVAPVNGIFSSTWSVFKDNALPGAFWVLDFNKGRLLRLNINNACGESPNILAIQVSDTLAITAPAWGANGMLYSPGLFRGQELAVIDRIGKTVHSIGPDVPGDPSHPAEVRAHAYQAVSAPSIDHRQIVVATRYSDRLIILSLKGELIAEGERPFRFEPRYRLVHGLEGPTLEFDDENRFGYISVATTEKAIYALFSGRTHKESGRAAATGSVIHVFSWRGALAAVMQLDADLSAITADSRREVIFGTKMTGSGGVFQYVVPPKYFANGRAPR